MGSPQSSSEPITVHDPVLAKLLLDPQARSVLGPFMQQACSITSAAGTLDVKPNTLLKQVRKLESLGVLQVVGEQRRAGRAVKLYASVARQFFVPFHVTNLETLERLLYAATDAQNRLIARSIAHQLGTHAAHLGYLVTPYRGVVRHDLSLDGHSVYDPLAADHPAFIRLWGPLRLEPTQAKRFQAELVALFERYEADRGDLHMVCLAFAPFPPS